jgi:uncharacterized protein YegP (UPF0339 family)
MSKPYFEVYQTENGKFRFRFKLSPKKVLFESHEYSSKRSCQKGVFSVKKNVPLSNGSIYNREREEENDELEIYGQDKTSSD